ncbi:MAG: RdgB/HAM1 family non-canonical purine NTP pyrophosphatase [Candidatus Hydrogenedentes bacterium]|nr:RdgB/HAM1 family non-canonical purine NTP pyrophosphatase [Candidatus Hydrogenedentota bacterium]
MGTSNRDKVRELREILAGLPWEICSLADLAPVPEPEEAGATFEENALLKARYYASHFSMACVADDSGLEVDALGGAPGVRSARYAGEGCSYSDNNEKLLDALAEMSWPERLARFVCCAAFAAQDGSTHVVRGTVEGRIAAESFGENGFGYDPVFVPSGHECTFAEMSAREKHAISHRGRAFRELRAWLETRS